MCPCACLHVFICSCLYVSVRDCVYLHVSVCAVCACASMYEEKGGAVGVGIDGEH